MIITKETDYALRMLRVLADHARFTASQLAQGEQIPQQFAYKILKKLEKGGLIRTLRGAQGGCILAADLEKVSLFDLMQIMQEDSALSACMRAGYQCAWCKAHGDTVCHVNKQLSAIQQKLDAQLQAHCLQEILFGP
ncbi:MAG: RrF2 family transcriptional regulator [Candidatus Fimivivens sp.]